jgi:suppressor of ftsI
LRGGNHRPLVIAVVLATAVVLGVTVAVVLIAGGRRTPPSAQPLAAKVGLPFTEPHQLRSHDGVLRARLIVQRKPVRVSGREVEGTVVNGRFAAPTLKVKPGDRLEITLVNRLSGPTNLHFHGLHVSPRAHSDNVFLNVAPGQTLRYVVHVPRDGDPGTYWYHSHRHPLAEEQVFGGLSGVLIIDGETDRLPPWLRHVRQRVFALKDVQVDGSGRRILTANINSDAPTTRLVNGLVGPRLSISPGEAQLWRLANIGADIWYRLRLDGQSFVVINEDGNVRARAQSVQELVLPPGKRYDVLVRGPAAGTTTHLRTLYYNQGGDQYPARTLATLRSNGLAGTPLALVGGLGQSADDSLRKLKTSRVARRRTIVFSEDDAQNKFFINGRQFSHHRIDERVKLGTVEQWRILNRTSEQHPFHIHVDDFEVLSVNGRPYHPQGEQDTVPLPAHGSVVVRLAFTDYTGRFVFHCHILNHEDNGMMATVQVTR